MIELLNMKKIFFGILNFIKKNKWWTAVIVIVVLILCVLIFSGKKSTVADSIAVARHNIVEVVSSTGNVKPISDLDLSFETGGQVSHVYVSVGDKVYQGQYLASLSNADLVAAVEQAKAGLKIAEANLSSLQNGATPEQIATNQSQVDKAKNDLADAKNTLINSVKDAYNKSDDAIRNYIDLLFTNPRSIIPSLQFQTDFQLQNDIVTGRASIENILNAWNTLTLDLTTNSNIDDVVVTSNNNLSAIQLLLQNLALAVNKLNPYSSVSQTTITLWKTNVSTVRSSISLVINNLSIAYNQYQSAISALNIVNSQLTLTKTGATADQLKAQEATVEQAQANVDVAEARLNKSIINSPINGVITNIVAKVGETIQAGMPALSVISYGQYEVESFVSEADIAKIKIGDVATTTLDAYGSGTFFETSVIKIDPAETVIENVPTYKVTLKFVSSSDDRIKSGMTANLDILTGQKDGVLAVPSRSVYSVDVLKYVKLLSGDDLATITETKVETGMRGVDGYVEIISGLNEGDKILASPNL